MVNPAEHTLKKELGPNESLLWCGVPRQGLCFRSSDAFLIPFSLMWGGFAFFWEYLVLTSATPGFFALWGIPFVLMGIYLIAGRFFVDSYQRGRTYYGLTNERVLILRGILNRKVTTLSIRNLHEISLNERPDGSGDVLFGSMNPMSANSYGTAWQHLSSSTMFESI